MNLREMESRFKTCLKKRVSITKALIITFMMTGMVMPSMARETDSEKITKLQAEVEKLKKYITDNGDFINIGKDNTDTLETSKKHNIVIIGMNNKNSHQNATIVGKSNENEAQFGTILGQDIKLLKGGMAGNNFIRIAAVGSGITVKQMQRAAILGNTITAEESNNASIIGYNNELKKSNKSMILGSDIKLYNSTATTVIGNEMNFTNKKAGGSIIIGKKVELGGEVNGAVLIGTDEGNGSYKNTKGLGKGITAVGSGAQALSNEASAFGYRVVANGMKSLVLGDKSESTTDAQESIAIGVETNVGAKKSVAIGRKAKVTGGSSVEGAIAIGTDDTSYINTGKENGDDRYPATLASATVATAVGAHAQAKALAASAYGARAFAYEKESLALGANSRAKIEGSVALGSYALADRITNGSFYDFLTDKKDETNKENYKEVYKNSVDDAKKKDIAKLATKSALSIGNIEKGITRQLMGLAAGSEDTDAVNVWQLKQVRLVTGDGKDGIKSDSGLTNEDKLKDKDLTTKINAVRNGEAGIIVYTNEKGERLVKANDGNYYLKDDVDEDGKPKDGKNKADTVKATLANSDGKTTDPTTALRIGNGQIDKDSNDAITGSQLNDLSTYLGLKVNGTKDKFEKPELTKLDGKNEEPKNIIEALNNATGAINKGMTFEANFGKEATTPNKVTKKLGETLSITAANAENAGKYTEGTSNYTGSNLATYIQGGKMYIGMKEDSKFKSLTIGGTEFGDKQEEGKGTITADNEGLKLGYDKANITISKVDGKDANDPKAKISGLKDYDVNSDDYGKEGIAATQKEVKDAMGKVKEAKEEITTIKSNSPFEYVDENGNPVVAIKDTNDSVKYYKAEDVENGKPKNGKQALTDEEAKKIVIKAKGNARVINNVASALLDNGDKVKDMLPGEIINAITKLQELEDKDNAVATLKDLAVVTKAGLTFSGNGGKTQKTLGSEVKILGGAKLEEVKTKVPATNGNPETETSDNGKADFDKRFESEDIATIVEKDGTIKIGMAKNLKNVDSIEMTEKDKNGKPKTKINIKAGEIDFSNGDKKEGVIKGLKDLDDSSTGDMAANKNYVDNKFNTVNSAIADAKKDAKEAKDAINSIKDNSPFEYADKDGKPVVAIKGDDGKTKYYKQDDIDSNTGKPKNDATAKEEKDLSIKAKGEKKVLDNVKSALGLDEDGANKEKAVNDLLGNGKGKTPLDKGLNKVTTLKDLQALGLAGIDFVGNSGDKIHKNLGQEIGIKGEDNINVVSDNGELKVKLSEELKGLKSAEFVEGDKKTTITPGKITGLDIPTDDTDAVNKKYVDDNLGKIGNKADDALSKAGMALGGVANAIATANLVQVTGNSDYRHLLSAAYGYYGKSHALAIGFSGISRDNKFIYKLSGSVNNHGDLGLGIGAGIMLGERHDHEERKDTRLLQKELKNVKEEFSNYKSQTDKKIAELESIIKKLVK